MDKDYINRKIVNCQGLVDNAISEDQKKIYQGYLDHWTAKLPKKNRPEEIAKKEEALREKKEAEEYAKREAEIKAEKTANIKAAEAKEAAERKALIAAKKAELAALVGEVEEAGSITVEDALADAFELENPNKKAYRYQNGDKFKTIAFTEYLNQKTQ